jgi:hypothetical protein
MKPDDRMDERIDRALRSAPLQQPADDLWPLIERHLREVQTETSRSSNAGAGLPHVHFGRRPLVTAALYALLIITGVAMSILLLVRERSIPTTHDTAVTSEEMLDSAQADIAQAVRYYDRAVNTLTVLAERNERNLDPRYVSAQKEKIALLRASIEECKTALRTSGPHPEVQHYLLAAYNDLQSTLQSMVTPTGG